MSSTAAIRGFIAWCEEFVGRVEDHNGTRMGMEFEEQLELLRRDAERPSRMIIPDIEDDKALVTVLDELMYRMRPALRTNKNCLTQGLRHELSRFIKNNGLDNDPHCFASMPKAQFPGLRMRVRELVLTLDGISIGVVGGYGHSISTPTLLHLNDILLARGAYVALDNVLDHESEEFGKWGKLTFVLHEVEDGSDVRTWPIVIPPDNGALLSEETCIIHSVVAGILYQNTRKEGTDD